jgi:hypothetical protein
LERHTGFTINVFLEDGSAFAYEGVHYKLEPSWVRLFKDEKDTETVTIFPAESVRTMTAVRPRQPSRFDPRPQEEPPSQSSGRRP